MASEPGEKAFSPPEADVLRCPSCGAPVGAGNLACTHCRAPLATARCAACLALSPGNAVRCARCGAALPRQELAVTGAGACPDCRRPLTARAAGAVRLAECTGCGGLFLTSEAFALVARDADSRAHVKLVESARLKGPSVGAPVRYRPCPVCARLMNRRLYSKGSPVILDVCQAHGLWLDSGEMTAIAEFVASGGYDRARKREREELREEVRALESKRREPALEPGLAASGGEATWGITELVASLVKLFS